MSKFYVIILLFTCLNSFAQSTNYDVVIVQKFYDDTLLNNYRKLKFEINLKAKLVTTSSYFSTHRADTLYISDVKTEQLEKYAYHKKRIVGDTIFNKSEYFNSNDTIITVTKKVYGKYGITYAARIFPKLRLVPYNEIKYQYDRNGHLIQIFEKHNSQDSEEYKTIFNYNSGIVARMTEYKRTNQSWKREKVWDYDLIKNKATSRKVKKTVNSLLIDGQFKDLPW